MLLVFELALIGLAIAVIPLSCIWFSSMAEPGHRFTKLLWITTFLTLDLVMFGAFTRLTDSGLGCPDWPGCYGTSSPFSAQTEIHAAQAAMPSGPVTWIKAWIEMIHRYFAMAIGALMILLTALAWRQRATCPPSGLPHRCAGQARRRRQYMSTARRRNTPSAAVQESCPSTLSPWAPTALLLLIIMQGAFGAWTVTQKLQPLIVTAHLLLGMTLLAATAWVAASQTRFAALELGSAARRWQWAAGFGLLLLVLQIALGGWVSANYAVLACADFPSCNGQWLPPMDFAQGFQLWRALGRTGSGGFISRDALVAIHWTHRTFAIGVLAYLSWLALSLRSDKGLRRLANGLLAMVAAQFATGLANILLSWPLPVAVAHNGGAAVMVLLLTVLNFRIASCHAMRNRTQITDTPSAAIH